LDNALATDRQRLSATIKDHLRGALLLTQPQQVTLDHTVQQAVAEYAGDHNSGIAYTQSASGANPIGACAGLVDRVLFPAEGMQGEGEWQTWSASMIQSYLPRTTLGPLPTESTLSPGLPLAMQPNASLHGQQRHEGYGAMFLGLSSDLYIPPFDDAEYDLASAMAMPAPGST
jgi:hypothetical protein